MKYLARHSRRLKGDQLMWGNVMSLLWSGNLKWSKQCYISVIYISTSYLPIGTKTMDIENTESETKQALFLSLVFSFCVLIVLASLLFSIMLMLSHDISSFSIIFNILWCWYRRSCLRFDSVGFILSQDTNLLFFVLIRSLYWGFSLIWSVDAKKDSTRYRDVVVCHVGAWWKDKSVLRRGFLVKNSNLNRQKFKF